MKILSCYKSILFVYVLLRNFCLYSAIFTIINHTGEDIRVKLLLNKSWGSKSMEQLIKKDFFFQFNTGVFALLRNGITWQGLSSNVLYYLDYRGIEINNPFMVGGFIRLYKDDKNVYRYEFKLGGRSGWGPVE